MNSQKNLNQSQEKVLKKTMSQRSRDKSQNSKHRISGQQQKRQSKSKSKTKPYQTLKPNFYTSSKQQDFENEMQKAVQQIKQRKQKMYSCIDLFNMMQHNNMQLRCINHNNVLTLYCFSERKVLCVNCIYGITKHRTHKVLPLKDCFEEITQDNKYFKEILNEDLKKLEESVKIANQNSNSLNKDMKEAIEQLQKQYKRKSDQLKISFEKKIEQIYGVYEKTIEKSRLMEKQVDEFKFKVWETLSKLGLGKRGDMINNESEIIKQVLCSEFSDLTKFQIRKITKRQLEKLSHQKDRILKFT